MSATSSENVYLREALRIFKYQNEEDRELMRLHAGGYLAEWEARIKAYIAESPFVLRDRMCVQYAWAIPDDDALDMLARHAPLIEIGAGTGYWAWLLRQRGVDILAYDIEPPTTPEHKNPFHGAKVKGYRDHDTIGTTWTEVLPGGPELAAQYPERTLFLCWPPYNEPMAAATLMAYTEAGGKRLVYVGEGDGGCCADAAFWSMLEKEWRETESVSIPQWPNMHDWLTVYERSE